MHSNQEKIFAIALGVGDVGTEKPQTTVVELRLFPTAQRILLDAVKYANKHPDKETFHITLFGSPDHGLHLDMDRATLANFAESVLLASDDETMQ